MSYPFREYNSVLTGRLPTIPNSLASTQCRTRSSVLAARFVCVRVLPKPNSRKAIRTKSHARFEWSAGRRRVVGHATRTDVATRPRFGRGARHRTIRLREPPASGALRLPALHHHRGSPPRLSTAAARVPLPLRGRPASSTGILTTSGMIRSHYRKIGLLSRINSYFVETPTRLNLRPRRLSDQ
jgi:hypothetical protein